MCLNLYSNMKINSGRKACCKNTNSKQSLLQNIHLFNTENIFVMLSRFPPYYKWTNSINMVHTARVELATLMASQTNLLTENTTFVNPFNLLLSKPRFVHYKARRLLVPSGRLQCFPDIFPAAVASTSRPHPQPPLPKHI